MSTFLELGYQVLASPNLAFYVGSVNPDSRPSACVESTSLRLSWCSFV